MKTRLLCALVCVLCACGTVRKVEPGAVKLGERMTVDIPKAWNHFDFPVAAPAQAQLWTTEGLAIDSLTIYYGLRDSQTLSNQTPQGGKKPLVFKSNMKNEEIAATIEGLLTQDGSTFKTIKFEPANLDGRRGFKLEFEKIRAEDHVQLRGLAYAATDKGELFALVYQAPRLTFYPRQKAQIEAIAASVKIR